MVRLTEHAQSLVAAVVSEGETVVDATAGNGYDTEFLLQLVGHAGRVIACDIQSEAIAATRRRCSAATNLTLHQGDHAAILTELVEGDAFRVAAVMMNLGYLPGGDKSLTTTVDSTLSALQASLHLLRGGGILSVLAYVGHPGGKEEAAAVENQLMHVLESGLATAIAWPDDKCPPESPRLFAVIKTA